MKTAVVIGATGLIGQFLSERLAEDSEYAQVLAIIRNPVSWKSSNIKNIHFDFLNWSDLAVQIRNFSSSSEIHFFCCLGTTIKTAGSEENFKKIDLDYVVEFAKIGQHVSAVKFVVVSALGADMKSTIFYNQIKGQMEYDVGMVYKGALAFVRPSLLLGQRREFRLGEKLAIVLSPIFSVGLVGPLKKFKPIHARQVAHAMVEIGRLRFQGIKIFENDELFSFR
jgi:uncharacterized protein YbjT (DUF2867 family)